MLDGVYRQDYAVIRQTCFLPLICERNIALINVLLTIDREI